jgi:formate hydrogenlyase subunit 3/multisubunit Na+/H+ antiporter MnhD subunit
MKIENKAIVLILIFIMVFSTFAFSYVNRFFYLSNQQQEEGLPKERIINSISENQRILAISNGFTIIYLSYVSQDNEIKNYLESLVNKHNVYLIERLSNENSLKIESLRGSREIKNPTLNQTIDLLCQIMIDRPIDCVMREIK